MCSYATWPRSRPRHSTRRSKQQGPRVREIQEVVVTVAEMLEKKGEERGLRLGEAKGRAEAKAEDVLAVLGARDVPVSGELRRRILGCQDLDLLDRWIDCVATAKSAAEVVGE
jgi:hypothetical protein